MAATTHGTLQSSKTPNQTITQAPPPSIQHNHLPIVLNDLHILLKRHLPPQLPIHRHPPILPNPIPISKRLIAIILLQRLRPGDPKLTALFKVTYVCFPSADGFLCVVDFAFEDFDFVEEVATEGFDCGVGDGGAVAVGLG